MAQQFAVPSDRRAPLLVRCYYFRADPRFGAVRDAAVAHCSYGGAAAPRVRAGVVRIIRRQDRGAQQSPANHYRLEFRMRRRERASQEYNTIILML
jgi:hypothetical protein